ncbi:MAG: fibrillarin-like rRNA/tRNA 2'-O-methyltransferase [Archaeoglobaceae archaeon]|nr:fibrillarin-like rRNA/tRNA 2'-O-methyltransferase [Archaeoglobaceae archaeon]MCX8152795.1 fibrillarin-like rRNA/tRNA 2'-O-methyltransferase [Archaeoglobaceae archaeon]MDW8013502.1 fibrillarin-like rRNA/tRNA 2'-O-methyltransferase [Archaeoglobaceae archaeon]
MKEVVRNVFIKSDNTIFTRSKYGSHYGEKVSEGFREWIPWRSKLAAMILKGYRINFKGNEKVLYLGAATGTTLSHLADIIDEGIIYAVEYAAKPFEKLLELVKERKNIIPLLADASKPWLYSGIVEKVDFIYQDIAQPNQIEILEENVRFFLKKGGEFLIMVKARSIDSVADPREVFDRVRRSLSKKFEVLASDSLEPYHRDHIFIHAKA